MENKSSHEIPLEIVLIGDKRSGKSSIGNRLHGDGFNEKTEITIGLECFSTEEKKFVLCEYGCTLDRQQEVFDRLSNSETINKKAAIGITIDSSKELNQDNFIEWLNLAIKAKKQKEQLLIFVLLTKDDLSSPEQIEDIKNSINQIFQNVFKKVFPNRKNLFDLLIFSCSAKNNTGITEAFTEVVNQCIKFKPQPVSNEIVSLAQVSKLLSPINILFLVSALVLILTFTGAILAIFPPSAFLAFGLLFSGAGSLMSIVMGVGALLLINGGYFLTQYIRNQHGARSATSIIEDNSSNLIGTYYDSEEENEAKSDLTDALFKPTNNTKPTISSSEEISTSHQQKQKFCILF